MTTFKIQDLKYETTMNKYIRLQADSVTSILIINYTCQEVN